MTGTVARHDGATGQRIIVLGALSAIGEAACRLLAAERAQFALLGRGLDRLDTVAADLLARGASNCLVFDADLALGPTPSLNHKSIAAALGGDIDASVIVYGVLGDQKRAETGSDEMLRILDVNFRSAAAWSLDAAQVFEAQGHGTLVAVGSVAGDRGRQSNYIYGAAKGGFGILIQGIAHRLVPSGARAILIKPGLVDSPMTSHMPKSGLLWSKPSVIAEAIQTACHGRGRGVVYSPWFWRWIMLIVRTLPEQLMHRTKL